jgi:hypothetical protein
MHVHVFGMLSRCRESRVIRTHLKAAVAALFGIPLEQIISAPQCSRERGDDCLFSISDTRGMQNTTIEIKGASFFCRKVLLLEIFTTLKDNHCSYGKTSLAS